MVKDFVKLLFLSIISIMLFILLYKFLCGEEIIPKKENRYYFEVDDASGISYNTKLYLNGFKIGKITKIEFDYIRMKTKVNIAIDKKIKLKKDSYITISSNLLGKKSLTINIGSGDDLDNNACVECKGDPFSLSQALNTAQQIITKINEIQQSFNIEEIKNKLNIGSTTDNGFISGFMNLLTNITDMVKNINSFMEEIKKANPNDVMTNINDMVKNINSLIEEIKKANPNDVMANINDILKDFKENALAWVKELKKKNEGKGFMSFSF